MAMYRARSGLSRLALRLSLTSSLLLALPLLLPGDAGAQQKSKFTAVPLPQGTTYEVGTTGGAGAKSARSAVQTETQGQAQAKAQLAPSAVKRVSVIVKLTDPSLAAYKGGIQGMAATSPAVTGAPALDVSSTNAKKYLSYLAQKQSNFAASARTIQGAEVRQHFDVVFGGVSMLVPETEIDTLRTLPGVKAVYLDQLLHLDTNVSPQFIGAPKIWSKLGGQEKAGEGVIVGSLDSGVWPEHPSYSDPDPAGNGYAPPPATWHGTACDFGNTAYNPNDHAFSCNHKLIGAHEFLETYKAVVGLLPTEFDSARDDDGHGTHTSTTAAGNAGVHASIFGVERGIVSGIAPRARIAAYKICGNQGCFESDSVEAIQQAILDGVNVINFSISGGANPYSDVVEQAFLDAYNAGIFVAASAGNSGPAADTTDHRGPWVTTVAASTTNRFFLSHLTVQANGGATLNLTGASITEGISVATPVVLASDLGDEFCLNPFAAGSVAGKIVVCRGGVNRIIKSFNVQQGGAVGMLLGNDTLLGLGTDNYFIPTVHLEVNDGDALVSFVSAHSGVTATFTDGEAAQVQGDVMAPFSSRGGTGQTLGVSKPDVTAPGVQILAGDTPLPATVEGGPQGELFQAIRGTSMSSPHVAGSGALLKALHPEWTPGQIKSALMTTATTKVVKEDGHTPADPFDMGAGRIDLRNAGDVGVTFDETGANYVALADQLWNANYPSIYLSALPGQITLTRTAHNTGGKNRNYRLDTDAPKDLTVSVPNRLKVPKNGDASFDITIDGRNVPIGGVRFAELVLKGDEADMHLPISIVRRQPAVTLDKACNPSVIRRNDVTTCTITMTNTAFDDANVALTDNLPKGLTLVAGSVVGATPSGNGLGFTGSLAAVVPATVSVQAGDSPAGGYLPLSIFGIDPVADVGDETISNFTVPAFVYAGETYTQVAMVSNGYLVVGGGTGSDVQFINQTLPDPTPPNNVLAPFWTDLNPGFSGAMRVGQLTDGVNSWLVFDWDAVPTFSNHLENSFEVWIGINGTQDISYAFGPINGSEFGSVTVGAENRFGNRGANFFVNGTGTTPVDGTQVTVTSTPGGPGETKVVTFQAKGKQFGDFQNCAQLTSQLFQGINLACANGRVH